MTSSTPTPPTFLKWLGDVAYTVATAISDTSGLSPSRRKMLGLHPRFRYQAEIQGQPRQMTAIAAGNRAGRRVLLIHGSPGDAADWSPLFTTEIAAGLLADCWLTAVDRPGFGPLRENPAEPSLARQAAALAPLLTGAHADNGTNPIAATSIVLGYSMGAPVAVQMALDYPGQIAGLILVGGALDPTLEEDLLFQRLADRTPVKAVLPRVLSKSNTELRALKGELQAMAPRLAELRMPVVAVHGTNDPLVPYANVDFMRRHFLGCTAFEVHTIENADHFLPWKNTADVIAGIRSMMALLDDRDAPADRRPLLDPSWPDPD